MGIAALISIMCLVGAYTAQYLFYLQPCFLCYLARLPYALFLGLYIVAHFFPMRRELWHNVGIGIFSAAAILAFYHIGVEQSWWEASSLCTPGSPPSFEHMAHQIASPIASCHERTPFLFGISMTVYNLTACLLALFILTFPRIKYVSTTARAKFG